MSIGGGGGRHVDWGARPPLGAGPATNCNFQSVVVVVVTFIFRA